MLKEIFVVTLKESILNVAKAWFTASKDISMDGKVYAVEQDEGKKKVIRNMLKGATSIFQVWQKQRQGQRELVKL